MMNLSEWHEQWFLTGLGERTKKALEGLNWVFSSAFLSRVLCGLTTALAARYMGPAQFGEANLALAAAYYIQIPLFFGIQTALMHYIPQASPEEKGSWILDGMRLSALFAVTTLIAGYLGKGVWAHATGVTVREWELALFWCAGFFLYTLGTTLFITEERFKAKAALEMAFAILFPLLMVLAWRAFRLTGGVYILVLALGYGFTGFIGLWRKVPNALRAMIHWPHVKTLLAYSCAASLGGVVAALMQASSRLIANRYLSLEQIGVISGYQGGSVQMALFLLAAGTQVFFPIASRTPNKKLLFAKLHRLFLLAFPLGVAALSGILWLYLIMLGRHYPLATFPFISFTLAGVLAGIQGVLLWFLAAAGRRGVLIGMMVGLVGGLVNVVACFALIPRFHVSGAAAATGIAYATGIFLCYLPWIREKAGI